MTIRAGTSWGEPGHLSPDAPVFTDDDAARRHLQQQLEQQPPGLAPGAGVPATLGELGLLGGDLHRTLGSPSHTAEDLRAGEAVRYPVDVGVVTIDGSDHVFLAHLVAHPRRRLRWWSARTVAVMNAGFFGDMDLGPRSHPNDGRLDVTEGALPLGERRRGRQRARSGSHVPHPGLSTRSVRELQVDAQGSGPLHVWLDQHHIGVVDSMSIRCVPDAVVVVA